MMLWTFADGVFSSVEGGVKGGSTKLSGAGGVLLNACPDIITSYKPQLSESDKCWRKRCCCFLQTLHTTSNLTSRVIPSSGPKVTPPHLSFYGIDVC